MNYFQDHPQLEAVLKAALQPGQEIFLVGGAVRDGLLNKKSHDLDFVLSGNVKRYARSVANQLNGYFYMLDEKRQTARVLLNIADREEKLVLDFAWLDQNSIAENLSQRDFSINAIAFDLCEQKIIDPLHGGQDLLKKKLKPCSLNAFKDDPVRVLRSVRFSIELNLSMDKKVVQDLKESVSLLGQVSAERLRDELFRLLSSRQLKTAITLLEHFGILDFLCPEVLELRGFEQGEPHVYDGWRHTLAVISELEKILYLLMTGDVEKDQQNLMDGLTILHLRKYQEPLKEHFSKQLNPNRPAVSLLQFAALYHDTGKPGCEKGEPGSRKKFSEHEKLGKNLVSKRAKALTLSQNEVKYLETVVGNHMYLRVLPGENEKETRRNLFHLFRETEMNAVDICLLGLADSRATYGPGLQQEHWIKKLKLCQMVFDELWVSPSGLFAPPDLINGLDLKNLFSLEQGPLIGKILAEVKEAQAVREIQTREDALELSALLIRNHNSSK